MVSLINKQLLLTAYAYLFIMEQQKAQQGSEALQLQSTQDPQTAYLNSQLWCGFRDSNAKLQKLLESQKKNTDNDIFFKYCEKSFTRDHLTVLLQHLGATDEEQDRIIADFLPTKPASSNNLKQAKQQKKEVNTAARPRNNDEIQTCTIGHLKKAIGSQKWRNHDVIVSSALPGFVAQGLDATQLTRTAVEKLLKGVSKSDEHDFLNDVFKKIPVGRKAFAGEVVKGLDVEAENIKRGQWNWQNIKFLGALQQALDGRDKLQGGYVQNLYTEEQAKDKIFAAARDVWQTDEKATWRDKFLNRIEAWASPVQKFAAVA